MLKKFQPNLTKFGHTLCQNFFLDLYSDLIIGFGMKNYSKMSPHMPESVHWFQVMGRFSSMSADLYSDLIIGLGIKNYTKMSPHMPESIHWFPSYRKGQLDTPTLLLTFT